MSSAVCLLDQWRVVKSVDLHLRIGTTGSALPRSAVASGHVRACPDYDENIRLPSYPSGDQIFFGRHPNASRRALEVGLRTMPSDGGQRTFSDESLKCAAAQQVRCAFESFKNGGWRSTHKCGGFSWSASLSTVYLAAVFNSITTASVGLSSRFSLECSIGRLTLTVPGAMVDSCDFPSAVVALLCPPLT
jgi:hypothetical protein